MSEPFLGEIQIVPYNFAPRGWAFCNGQILPISQNTALFSILGTTYGGNGTTNYALPNLQGATPIHWGQGAGLSSYIVGDVGGTPSVTLLSSEMPAHTHQLSGDGSAATTGTPNASESLGKADVPMYNGATSLTPMSNSAIGVAGGGAPHNNLQPYLVLSFVIAMQGVYPSRN